MMDRQKLPKPPMTLDLADVIGKYAHKVDNRSLLLDKFVVHKSWPQVETQATNKMLKLDDASRWSFIRVAQNGESYLRRELDRCEAMQRKNKEEANKEEAKIKADVLQQLIPCSCRKLPANLAKQKIEQNKQFVEALKSHPHLTGVVCGVLKGRLLINLSDSLIPNAGICLDRNTGIPYIPGSAIKGVTRHVALAALRAGRWTLDEFIQVFGSSESDFNEKKQGELSEYKDVVPQASWDQRGGIDFLAAYPLTEPEIVVDISNVHYPTYYQTGKIEDLAIEAPSPNTFPAVKEGARYAFCIIANGYGEVNATLFEKAKGALEDAITIHGIGAKTAAGYGWFEVEKCKNEEARGLAVEQHRDADLKREEEKRKAEREQALAELSPEERLKDWVLNTWKPKNFPAESFKGKLEEERILIIKLMRNDEDVKACWLTIKEKVEKGKKADQKRFRILCDDLRSLANKKKNEIGGKLP